METVTRRSEYIEAKEYIHRTWKDFTFTLKRDIFVPPGVEDECIQLGGILGMSLAILEQEEEVEAAETFAIDAAALTRNVLHLLNNFCNLSSSLPIENLIRDFKLVENQIKGLISRATGIGPPMGEDGPLVGIEEDVKFVTSRLLAGKARGREVVCIVGLGGIGKTSLVQKVYHSANIVDCFPRRAWVRVPRDVDPYSLLLKIAIQLLPLEEIDPSMSQAGLIKWVSLRFSSMGGKYLLVLDDVQTPEVWNIIGKLLPRTSNSSRIMITTRSRDLEDAGLDCYTFEKRALSDEESWELFNARLGFGIPEHLEEVGRGIVMKCTGLPSAICRVTEGLSKGAATHEHWSMVLQQISEDQLSHYGSLLVVADSLPSNWKQCLLYFGLFHQDTDVPARRLIAYWVAEELLQRGMTKPPECIAEELLMKLVQENVVQVAKWKLNGKVKSCRMHYLLRDSWLSKTQEAYSPAIKSKACACKSSHCTGMTLRLADHLDKETHCFTHIHGNDTISSSSLKYFYQELRSFLSFDSREGPFPGQDLGKFFRKCIAGGCFKMLRVIDLEGVFRPTLPNSIGKLTQLRYLCLRWTYLETLPTSIGNLLNLQTLDLKHTNISRLPGSLWKIQQLRHLYLSESYRSKFVPPPNTSTLIDIQTLWGAYLNEETTIKDGLDRLINLRKLGLACRLTLPLQMAMAEWITKLNHLESLRLRSIDEKAHPSNLYLESLSGLKKLSSIYLFGRLENPVILNDFPESLTEITLSLSGLIEDPMPKLEKLPNLRILRLFAGSFSGKIMTCSSGGFPLLRVLKLWKLEALEEWAVEEGALSILREVEIRSCHQLKMIPDGLKYLLHCHELKITNMPVEFKARITDDQGQDWYKIAHVPSIVIKN